MEGVGEGVDGRLGTGGGLEGIVDAFFVPISTSVPDRRVVR